MAEAGGLERVLGGVRGQVTIAALLVTVVMLTGLGITASILLSARAESDVRTAVETVLDGVEQRLRDGEAITSLTHPSGVDVLVDRAFDGSGGTAVIATRTVRLEDGRTISVNARASTTNLNTTIRTLRITLWILMPLAALLTAAVANLTVKRALEPVSAITNEARRIGRSPGAGRVPVPTTGDEVAELAETINEMLAALEAHEVERRRFLSDASHELRSPLMVLINEADLATNRPDATDLSRFARAVTKQTARLNNLTSDLLALAVSEEQAVNRTPVDLVDLVAEEMNAQRQDIPIALHGPTKCELVLDEPLVRRAVRNLLDNATRYAESAIQVEITSTDSDVVVAVEDDGPGVAPSEREDIFRRLYRPDESRSRRTGGAGLGLAVVAACAEAHAGDARALAAKSLCGARIELSLRGRCSDGGR